MTPILTYRNHHFSAPSALELAQSTSGEATLPGWARRGINRIEAHELLNPLEAYHYQLVLNNLCSFSSDRDTASTFGDAILETQVPGPKLLYFPGLLPGILQGEQEHLVIGGVYQVQLGWW